MRRRAPSGFTLIELMVAAAVAMIAITAATATLVNQVKNQRDVSRRNAIGVQLALAEVILDRQLSNAALNFADPRYGFRIRNRISSSLANGDGTSINVVALGANQAGAVAETDVIEIAWGNPTIRRGGRVVSCGTPSCNNSNGTGTVQLATTEPLNITEATVLAGTTGASGPLILFTDEAGASCTGRATTITPGVTTSMTFNYLDADAVGTNPTATTCPAAGMFVYGADTRRRYMVYQQANGANLGIYVQEMQSGSPAFGTPTLLVGGIEDMQVRAHVVTSTGATEYCDDPAVPNAILYPSIAACSLSHTNDSTSNDYQVRSADVRLTVRGTQPLIVKDSHWVRPLSYDHAALPVAQADDIYRSVGEFSVLLINSSLVTL